MLANKNSNLTFGIQKLDQYVNDLDKDIKALFSILQGRVRFGAGSTGTNGENMAGQFVQFTSDGSADAEFSVSHTLGSIPIGYIVLWQDKAGSLYQGPSTGTAWTTSAVSLKCNVASVTFLVFLIR